MNYRLFVFVAVCIFSGCGDKDPKPIGIDGATDSLAQASSYFPVMDFLRSEISKVDSLPVGIMRYRSSRAASDSGYIEGEEFRKLASEFVPPALNDSIFKKWFRETSFVDKSTGNATFFYNTQNEDLDLRRVDVVTQHTDTYDKVKSIYLEKRMPNGEYYVTKKLFWKPERNFQVITQVTKDTGDIETEIVKVVWDNRE